MSVGGVRGPGGRGGPKGPKGAGGPGGAGRAGKGTFGKVDRTEKLAGVSREAGVEGASGVGGAGGVAGAAGVGPTDPVTAQALEIAKQLKSGQLKTKEEATKKFVAEILKEKLRMQSKALTSKIADTLQDDPRLNQALERLWAKG